jgi:DNA-binding transcriptional LysR family regulator
VVETLSNLESFVRSAELTSFSEAARRLGLTPAAVSRNVAQLERNLGIRLFQRSTRGLTLTEAGERFLAAVSGGLDSIQSAIADVSTHAGQPAGTLKLSAAPGFARDFLLPLMPQFLHRYPAVLPDWHLDNRQVDLIAGGFDAAIGGGFELTPGVVARELATIKIIAVTSPQYLQGRRMPKQPADLKDFDGIVMRSAITGRIRHTALRDKAGREQVAEMAPRMSMTEPDGVVQAVLMGMGVALLAVPNVLQYLESGQMVRILPGWSADAGPISLYFTSQKLLPAKTRVFVDFVTSAFGEQRLAKRFLG